jgi:hypothetical protein
MPTVELTNGETREYDKIGIEQGLVVGYGEDEGPPHVAGTRPVLSVYPSGSVLEIDVGDEEDLHRVSSDSQADQFEVQ